MKKYNKAIAFLLIICMMSLTLTSCGQKKENNGSVGKVELPEFTYVAEYEKIETEDYLGQVFFDENGFYYIVSNYDEETGVSSLEFYHYDIGTKIAENIEIPMEENEYVVQGFINTKKELVLLTQLTDYLVENPITQFFINEYNMETEELNRTEITKELDSKEDYLYIQYAVMDSEGKVYLSNGESYIWILNNEFKKEARIDITTYINAMGISKNDDFIISAYSDNGKNIVQKYNPSSKTFGAEQEIDFYLYSQNSMAPGITKDFIIKTDTGLSEYSFSDNKSKEIVNWINSDINGDIIQNFIMLEDGRILLFTEDWNEDPTNYELVYLTKTNTSELPVKELISLKTLYLNYDLKAKIIEFNKTNLKYRLVVETYDTTDYEAAMIKYQTDLATGNASDIIDLGNSNIAQLSNKGLLEDLYPYIDADPEFERTDFFQNVLDAYTVNNKLSAIIPSVYLVTMIAKTKFVGEEPGWTPKDIVELSKTLPEDTKLFEYGSKEQILNMLVSYDLDSYIDWKTGECKFASEDFISLMEFSNQFPTEEEYEAMFQDDNFDYDMMNGEDKIASDKLILADGYFSNISDYQYTMSRFNEPAVCIGFPSVEGSGTFLGNSNTALGMNANSTKKDGAWEFIRYFLTEDAAENAWGLPVNKNVYNKQIKKAMEPMYFEKDEEIYVPEEQRRTSADGRIERPVSSIYQGGEEKFIYAPTQEDVDALTSLYESTSSLVSYNNEILAIINEEADGYFTGQKEAKAVADIIQSRLQIFVNENR